LTGSTPQTHETSACKPVHVAGLRVCPATLDSALDLVWNDIRTPNPHVFVLVNAHSAPLRADSPDYAAVLEHSRSIGLPDGYSVNVGGRLLGLGDIGRTPGPDLFAHACQRAAGDGTRFFLLGGQEGVSESLAEALVSEFPGLVICGVATPPFGKWSDEVSADLTSRVRDSGTDVLWMGVSAPKQEVWSLQRLDEIGAPAVCVGAAFDFLSGRTKRAPQWMRREGLEWLFRLVTEPRRLWKRYLVGNARFIIDLVRFGRRPPPRT